MTLDSFGEDVIQFENCFWICSRKKLTWHVGMLLGLNLTSAPTEGLIAAFLSGQSDSWRVISRSNIQVLISSCTWKHCVDLMFNSFSCLLHRNIAGIWSSGARKSREKFCRSDFGESVIYRIRLVRGGPSACVLHFRCVCIFCASQSHVFQSYLQNQTRKGGLPHAGCCPLPSTQASCLGFLSQMAQAFKHPVAFRIITIRCFDWQIWHMWCFVWRMITWDASFGKTWFGIVSGKVLLEHKKRECKSFSCKICFD